MRPVNATILLASMLLAGAPGAVQAQEPSGTWLTQSGETRVRIARCGAAFCGTIVAAQGNDVNNPDAVRRSRPLVGVQMISGMQPSGPGAYKGSLYNPQDGKTYTGNLTVKGASQLELSGCVLGGLICRSQTWTRVN